MNFIVLTIFPEMFHSFWEHGIIKKAIDRKKIDASAINIRDFAEGQHRVTDDRPFGGGCGMVMKPEPLAGAIRAAKEKAPFAKSILLSPQGRCFNQALAFELASHKGAILVCGRYEGVDERICDELIDDEISIGDYVLTGGELAAMVIIEAITRLIPGTLGGVLTMNAGANRGEIGDYVTKVTLLNTQLELIELDRRQIRSIQVPGQPRWHLQYRDDELGHRGALARARRGIVAIARGQQRT